MDTDQKEKIYMGFWGTLPNPFFCLAPMADVTDPAFRQIVARYSRHGEFHGGPDVLWTEFVSADGLASAGRDILLRDFEFTEGQHPIVAQIFGSNLENIEHAARLALERGFDGIDINMGCPDKTIEKQGAGACMIKTPELALECIRAAKRGATSEGRQIPVSVKTRVGYNKVEIDEWIPLLLKEGIATLTVHARTRKELSKVPAKWEYIKKVVEIRDALGVPTKIIGNGDVADIADGLEKAQTTGCDGIMIGRAIFGNPWLFDRSRTTLVRGTWKRSWYSYFLPAKWRNKMMGDARYTVTEVPLEEKLKALIEHAHLFEELLGDIKSFAIMKKHFKAYIHGFQGAKELRVKLMEEGNNATATERIIREYFVLD